MAYKSIRDLPANQTDQYDGRQKMAFLAAFNRTVNGGNPEDEAFSAAHSAAKRYGLGGKEAN